ncbi:aspartic peptidase domain-containing protein [Dichotomopilus funicola]|uniref:Aspartic peptidase domain-containing protein n=1 Tax=Dichotomopilus funicola TaxID=1934379 RepID=A0AAN6VBG9_9PEZI|nr:aspartic peptidase domain-containing protein [Dichotomopilus funicola]
MDKNNFQLFTSLRYDPVLLSVPTSNISYAGWNWDHASPLYMLDYHRDRMLQAATHWGWAAAIDVLKGEAGLKNLERYLLSNIGDNPDVSLKLRVVITRDGELSITHGVVPETTLAHLLPRQLPTPDGSQSAENDDQIPSKSPGYDIVVDGPNTARSEYTHFKTTKRDAYTAARERAHIVNLGDKREVLIVNDTSGAIMEGSLTTPYFWRQGKWVTPAVSKEYSQEQGSGGQSGTSRRWALERFVKFAVEDTILVDFRKHTQFRKARGLSKIRPLLNNNYRRHGTKSYVYALNKFGFQPTKPGPYFQKFAKLGAANRRPDLPGVKPGLVREGLYKKPEDGGEPGKVTAEDQPNDAEYLCEVAIGSGSDAQKVLLDFDTGSADLWVNSERFHYKKSRTFRLQKEKTWRIQYGDGSSASGPVGTDSLTIGGIEVNPQTIEIATQMSSQFMRSRMDGLLGLAFSKLNTVHSNGTPDPQRTPVDNMISQHDIPKQAQLFTSAMYSGRSKSKDSFYTFGWIDEALVKSSGEEIAWVDIDKTNGFWMFPSEHATVNEKKLTFENNMAIADTGTTLALVSDELCDALYAQIPGAKYSEEYQGWLIPHSVRVHNLPKLSISVGRKQFFLSRDDLRFAPAEDNYWYGGVQSRGENPFDILGGTFLKSIYAIWDQGNTRFGAVPKIQETEIKQDPEYDLRPLTEEDRGEMGIAKSYGDISSHYFEPVHKPKEE